MTTTHLHVPSPNSLRRGGNLSRLTKTSPGSFLDEAYQRLMKGSEIEASLASIFLGLHEQRTECTPQQWKDVVAQHRLHPVMELLHQDPFTYRAYSKPRGYAGDAVMLDYIYGNEEGWAAPVATPLGSRIYQYTTLAPASAGVRARRGFIANVIDRLAAKTRRPHIASIAAGHFREASLSVAIKRRQCGRVVALDADGASLEEVQRTYGHLDVETVPSHIRGLVNGKLQIGQFDLVYSTGLFDYLEAPIGRRLVARMFSMLRPGGRLLVANFLPGIRDVGYMETFMDWNLIYRSRQEMIDLTMEIPQADIGHVLLFAEENQNIIFVEVQRRYGSANPPPA